MDLLYTAHVPAGDGPFPTLVGLHGWGASAHDLLGLAPILHGGEALVLCPQGPVAFPIGQGIPGYGWFPLRESGPVDPDEYARGVASVERFLDRAAERYPIDARKLALVGFSQGGVIAYDIALRQPDRFAGVLALSSWLPPGFSEGLPADPERQNLPVLVMHGTEDPMIPVDRARESRDALLRLGVPVVYREHAMGHEIRPEALRDLVGFLEDKVFTRILVA